MNEIFIFTLHRLIVNYNYYFLTLHFSFFFCLFFKAIEWLSKVSHSLDISLSLTWYFSLVVFYIHYMLMDRHHFLFCLKYSNTNENKTHMWVYFGNWMHVHFFAILREWENYLRSLFVKHFPFSGVKVHNKKYYFVFEFLEF